MTVAPILGLPEIRAGDDLAHLLADACRSTGLAPEPGDVVVVTQKIVSKAEGRAVRLDDVTPSAFAATIADQHGQDARVVELVLSESRRIVRMDRGILIAETRHGFVCANAGVDVSNAPAGCAVLLPIDPDASAQRLRDALHTRVGFDLPIVICDTFGRPWREGFVNVAVGVAGLFPHHDYRGANDDTGRRLHHTVIAVVDELAAAAELVMGKTHRAPAALIRGYEGPRGEGRARDLVRPMAEDLFR
jgi:coenzyme F420-0:L-glutamate ligase / coenzyme F420-1:gamma-L-glutamate ligase